MTARSLPPPPTPACVLPVLSPFCCHLTHPHPALPLTAPLLFPPHPTPHPALPTANLHPAAVLGRQSVHTHTHACMHASLVHCPRSPVRCPCLFPRLTLPARSARLSTRHPRCRARAPAPRPTASPQQLPPAAAAAAPPRRPAPRSCCRGCGGARGGVVGGGRGGGVRAGWGGSSEDPLLLCSPLPAGPSPQCQPTPPLPSARARPHRDRFIQQYHFLL